MIPVNEQISNSTFLQYEDYFTTAALAGINSAKALFNAIAPATLINTGTMEVYLDAPNAKNSLIVNMRSSYEQIYTNAVALDPMRDAFIYLSEHIREWTNASVDTYLTNQGLEVSRTYANISNLVGESISNTNVES